MRRFFALLLSILAVTVAGATQVQARESSPAAAGACTVEPYALTDVLANAAASPVSVGADDGITERPSGDAADEETVAAVTATVDQFFACVNEGYLYRYVFLFTPEYLTSFLAGSLSTETNAQLADEIINEPAPMPLPEDQQTVLVGIEDIQVLEDGRVVATVVGDDLTSETAATPVFFIFEEVDGVYLIDEVIDPVVEGGTPES